MKYNIKNLIFTCLAVIAISSCGDVANFDNTIGQAQGARVKFFHAVSGGSPLTVTTNGQKWTSVLTTAKYTDSIVYASTYPAIDYTVLPAGSTKFTAKLPLSVNAKDTVISELTTNLEDSKYYLLLAADTFPSPKLFMVPDIRDDKRNSNKTYFRFANFLVKAPTAGYDVILARQPSQPFANIKYGEASAYVEFEPTGAIADTVFLRVPGTTTNAYTFPLGATKFAANRSAIFVLRGVVGGTGTKVPTFSILTTN
jgi:hypothetical protein